MTEKLCTDCGEPNAVITVIKGKNYCPECHIQNQIYDILGHGLTQISNNIADTIPTKYQDKIPSFSIYTYYSQKEGRVLWEWDEI